MSAKTNKNGVERKPKLAIALMKRIIKLSEDKGVNAIARNVKSIAIKNQKFIHLAVSASDRFEPLRLE